MTDPRLFLVSIVFSIKSVYTKIYDHPSPEQKKKEEKEEVIEDQIEFTKKCFILCHIKCQYNHTNIYQNSVE